MIKLIRLRDPLSFVEDDFLGGKAKEKEELGQNKWERD